MKLKRVLHLFNLHILNISTTALREDGLLPLTSDVETRCKCKVEEMTTCWMEKRERWKERGREERREGESEVGKEERVVG